MSVGIFHCLKKGRTCYQLGTKFGKPQASTANPTPLWSKGSIDNATMLCQCWMWFIHFRIIFCSLHIWIQHRAVQDYDLYLICYDYFELLWLQYDWLHILSSFIAVEYDTIWLRIQYDTVVIFNHNNNILKCHWNAQIWCHSGSVYAIFGHLFNYYDLGTPFWTSCNHKIISLPSWVKKTKSIPTASIQCMLPVTSHTCPLSCVLPPTFKFVLAVLHSEINDELDSQSLPSFFL